MRKNKNALINLIFTTHSALSIIPLPKKFIN